MAEDREVGRTIAGLLIVGGAFGVVLAGVDSAVFDLERHLAPKALALHVTALALLLFLVPSRDRPRWGAAGTLLALFVAWSALSTLFAENRWLALRAWGISFSSLVLYLAARQIGKERRWKVASGVLAAVVLAAGVGVAQSYGADWWWLSESRPPGGTFGNRNFLAHVAAIGLGPMVAAAGRSRGRWVPAALLGTAILVLAIVLTRSRAAWLAAGASVLATAIVLALARRRASTPLPWGRLALAGAALATAVVAAVLLPNRLDWRTDAPYAATLARLGEYRDGSGAGRLVQYRNSLRLVADRPVLGVGPGNWFVEYPRVTTPGDPAYSAHLDIPTNPWPSSDWVAAVVERGAVGALLLFLAGGAAALTAAGAFRRSGEEGPASPEAAAMAVGALAAAFVAGLFDAVLLLAAPSFVAWTLAGLAAPEPPRAVTDGRVRARRALRTAGVAIALGLVLVSGGSTAALLLTREDERTESLARAARVAPWEHRLHLVLARRGRCPHARRAGELMPHHEAAAALARSCGG